MIGLSFKTSQNSEYLLKNLLSIIDVESYHWLNITDQCEVWNRTNNTCLFCKSIYTGDELKRFINLPHYVVFLKLQAYSNIDNYENIQTINDFLNSNCKLLVLIYDCEFIEIYTKDKRMLKKYCDYVQENNIDVEYIYYYNARKTMDVL